MRNLESYGKQCIENLNAIGIYPHDIANFDINSRAKNRWGQASKRYGLYSISINAVLLQENIPEASLLDTLYHELLHCVDGCFNHGAKWKELAELVNDCYNINISTTSTAEEKLGDYANIYRKEKEKPTKRFIVKCVDCGQETVRIGYRAPKWYAHPEDFQCAKCKGILYRVKEA